MQPLVLIIEDQPDLGRLYKKVCELGGAIAELAHDGDAGMQRVKDHGAPVPDLFFIDLHLPGQSGEEIIQYLHNDRRYRESIIVVVTADEPLGKSIRDRGIVDAVEFKPVNLDVYHEYIRLAAERMAYS